MTTDVYLKASNTLDETIDIDAESPGPTTNSSFVTKNSLHVANFGDSCCLLVI